jgi:hypothetical protein
MYLYICIYRYIFILFCFSQCWWLGHMHARQELNHQATHPSPAPIDSNEPIYYSKIYISRSSLEGPLSSWFPIWVSNRHFKRNSTKKKLSLPWLLCLSNLFFARLPYFYKKHYNSATQTQIPGIVIPWFLSCLTHVLLLSLSSSSSLSLSLSHTHTHTPESLPLHFIYFCLFPIAVLIIIQQSSSQWKELLTHPHALTFVFFWFILRKVSRMVLES